jgi:hypothetical protein
VFQRLAVAYGLSIPPAERSQLGLPDDIEDVKPGQRKAPPWRYEDSKEILQ